MASLALEDRDEFEIIYEALGGVKSFVLLFCVFPEVFHKNIFFKNKQPFSVKRVFISKAGVSWWIIKAGVVL